MASKPMTPKNPKNTPSSAECSPRRINNMTHRSADCADCAEENLRNLRIDHGRTHVTPEAMTYTIAENFVHSVLNLRNLCRLNRISGG
jgi:hypothetical protein